MHSRCFAIETKLRIFALFCKMGNKQSHNEYTNPETKLYEAARDGTTHLTVILKRLNADERKTALETKQKMATKSLLP